MRRSPPPAFRRTTSRGWGGSCSSTCDPRSAATTSRSSSPARQRCGGDSRPSLHHAYWGQPVGRGPVAELALYVAAPAIGGARGRDPAGVDSASRHRSEAHTGRRLHEHRGQLVRRVGPAAVLAAAVAAPAIGGAGGGRPAGGVVAAPARAAVTPQVWAAPAVTAAKLTPAGACTSTGVNWFVLVPSPSWPLPLPPQQ